MVVEELPNYASSSHPAPFICGHQGNCLSNQDHKKPDSLLGISSSASTIAKTDLLPNAVNFLCVTIAQREKKYVMH
jgi:hypothetical protein